MIREQTLKAVAVLSPKLKSNIINESLIRHLAKLLTDPIPGIRTNTIICMAKLNQFLDNDSRSKVLVQGFVQSLRDPFPFARKASLMGISASIAAITTEDIAKRILPAVSTILVDQDRFHFLIRTIRTLAFDVLNVLVKKMKEWSDQKVDPPVDTPSKDTKPEGWINWSVSGMSSTLLNGRNSTVSKPSTTTPSSPAPNSAKTPRPSAERPLSSTHPPLIPVAVDVKVKAMSLKSDSKQKIVIPVETDNDWGTNWNEDALFETPSKGGFLDDTSNNTQISGWGQNLKSDGPGWDDKWSPEKPNSKKDDVWEDWG